MCNFLFIKRIVYLSFLSFGFVVCICCSVDRYSFIGRVGRYILFLFGDLLDSSFGSCFSREVVFKDFMDLISFFGIRSIEGLLGGLVGEFFVGDDCGGVVFYVVKEVWLLVILFNVNIKKR